MSANEGFDGVAQLVFACETGTVESFTLQQAEYDFNLVEPTGGGRGEVKMDTAFVLCQPGFVLLVR